jgi:transcriptional regulator with XRE-family HTH domain
MPQQENNFPEIIKSVREQVGLSQETLAREIGVFICERESLGAWKNQAATATEGPAHFDKFCSPMQKRGLLTVEINKP